MMEECMYPKMGLSEGEQVVDRVRARMKERRLEGENTYVHLQAARGRRKELKEQQRRLQEGHRGAFGNLLYRILKAFGWR